MFKNPFSFKGRIRRSELFLSIIIIGIVYVLLAVILLITGNFIIPIILSPLIIWFLAAQSAKRCHDRGNPGWFQVIPFYFLWMFFGDSDIGVNAYGLNPKGIKSEYDEIAVDLEKKLSGKHYIETPASDLNISPELYQKELKDHIHTILTETTWKLKNGLITQSEYDEIVADLKRNLSGEQ